MAETTPRCGIRGCPQPAKPGAFIVVDGRRHHDGTTTERRLPICASHERALKDIKPGTIGLVRL